EAAALEPVGSREGATLVPEELRLDERLGQRRAVDGDEGTLGTPARIVDGASDQFLRRGAVETKQSRHFDPAFPLQCWGLLGPIGADSRPRHGQKSTRRGGLRTSLSGSGSPAL